MANTLYTVSLHCFPDRKIHKLGCSVLPSRVKQTQNQSSNVFKVQSSAGPVEAHFSCLPLEAGLVEQRQKHLWLDPCGQLVHPQALFTTISISGHIGYGDQGKPQVPDIHP